MDRSRIGGKVIIKPYILPNRSPQKISSGDDNFVEIDVARPEDLSPAECQKLACKSSASLRGLFDLANLLG